MKPVCDHRAGAKVTEEAAVQATAPLAIPSFSKKFQGGPKVSNQGRRQRATALLPLLLLQLRRQERRRLRPSHPAAGKSCKKWETFKNQLSRGNSPN